MIGTYFGGGERQRIDLGIRIDMQRKELTITKKSNGLGCVYDFSSLATGGGVKNYYLTFFFNFIFNI